MSEIRLSHVFETGKHEGKSIAEILPVDPDYIIHVTKRMRRRRSSKLVNRLAKINR